MSSLNYLRAEVSHSIRRYIESREIDEMGIVILLNVAKSYYKQPEDFELIELGICNNIYAHFSVIKDFDYNLLNTHLKKCNNVELLSHLLRLFE